MKANKISDQTTVTCTKMEQEHLQEFAKSTWRPSIFGKT
jgi:hypothetical protein